MNSFVTVASLGLLFSFAVDSVGQVLERAWVKRYSLNAAKTNQATMISLAPDGGVVVAGTSTGPAGDSDYAAVKYSANGEVLWQARYDLLGLNDELRGMAVDPAGNVILTGTTETVKYDSAGNFKWAVPVDGRAVIANAQYVYVTGFSDSDIVTAQLENNETDGKENWRRSADGPNHLADIGQTIALDANQNVYAAGKISFGCSSKGDNCDGRFGVVSYDGAGAQRWFSPSPSYSPPYDAVFANSLLVRADGTLFIYGTDGPVVLLSKVNSTGAFEWERNYITLPFFVGTKMLTDSKTGNLVITGVGFDGEALVGKVTDAGSFTRLWSLASAYGNGVAQDSIGNFYVGGGLRSGAESSVFLAKISNTGQQLALDSLNPPGTGSSVGTAMVIDSGDAVYVTGYASTVEGGTEFVTVKYMQGATIARAQDGTVTLSFPGEANQPYIIEATQTFWDWVSISTNTANADGLVNFIDPNAGQFSYRLYRGKQP